MTIEPIAYFHSPFKEKFGIPRQSGLASDVEGTIVFAPEFRNPDFVRGLEDFDYMWLIWEFSGNERSLQPTVRPPRLGGNERIGVFASRSPFRPNPLGLSSVKITKIEAGVRDGDGTYMGPVIHVLGADLMDGTPIYDIKPYVAYADSHPEAGCGFVDEKSFETLEVAFGDGVDAEGVDTKVIAQILSQDPRPSYKKDSGKTYGMQYGGFDIRFKVESGLLTVTEIARKQQDE